MWTGEWGRWKEGTGGALLPVFEDDLDGQGSSLHQHEKGALLPQQTWGGDPLRKLGGGTDTEADQPARRTVRSPHKPADHVRRCWIVHIMIRSSCCWITRAT